MFLINAGMFYYVGEFVYSAKFPNIAGKTYLIFQDMGKRVTYERERLNEQTGELVTTHRDSILPSEPDYVKLYLADMGMLSGLLGATNPILHELLKLMDYKNRIVLNASVKREIAKELDISVKTIDNALGSLLKQNVLIRKDIGLFLGNPQLFGKGEWKNIRELRLTIHYTEKGKTISTEVFREGEPEVNDEALMALEMA